jgi:hypothetical protein
MTSILFFPLQQKRKAHRVTGPEERDYSLAVLRSQPSANLLNVVLLVRQD